MPKLQFHSLLIINPLEFPDHPFTSSLQYHCNHGTLLVPTHDTVLDSGELQLKDLYPKESLKIDINYVSKSKLSKLNIIDPELIKDSITKLSGKRNTLSEGSSSDHKKKKQDTQGTDSNGV